MDISFNPTRTQQTKTEPTAQHEVSKPPAPANSTGAHGPAQESGGTSPTAGGRETTTQKHKDLEEMTQERLAEDPEYMALKEKLDSCSGLEAMFTLIDKNVGLRDDFKITMADILALVNDTGNKTPGVRDAAKWLNDHREILLALKGDDDLIGLHDVKNFIAGMKAQLKEMQNNARSEVRTETGAAASPATGATATAAATATQTPEAAQRAAEARAVMAEADQALPKPAPSQFSGLEGASENLNNMVGWAEAETDRLTKLMGKTDDPAALKQLEAKINQLSRRMQQMTALMNQIMTAMQNISKMYSDIAMNSVRNIR